MFEEFKMLSDKQAIKRLEEILDEKFTFNKTYYDGYVYHGLKGDLTLSGYSDNFRTISYKTVLGNLRRKVYITNIIMTDSLTDSSFQIKKTWKNKVVMYYIDYVATEKTFDISEDMFYLLKMEHILES